MLVVAAAAACSAPPAESPSTALTVCSTGDYRPFTYRDADGQWSGMDIDLVRDFARESGAELQLVPTTWPTLMTDLGQKCELAVGGISITADRVLLAEVEGRQGIAQLFDVPPLPYGEQKIATAEGGGQAAPDDLESMA